MSRGEWRSSDVSSDMTQSRVHRITWHWPCLGWSRRGLYVGIMALMQCYHIIWHALVLTRVKVTSPDNDDLITTTVGRQSQHPSSNSNTTSRIGFRKFNVLRRNSILYFFCFFLTNKENENICVIHGNPENRRSKPLLINRTQDWILRPCPVQSFFWKMGSQHIHIRFFSSFENWPRIDVNGCHVKF